MQLIQYEQLLEILRENDLAEIADYLAAGDIQSAFLRLAAEVITLRNRFDS